MSFAGEGSVIREDAVAIVFYDDAGGQVRCGFDCDLGGLGKRLERWRSRWRGDGAGWMGVAGGGWCKAAAAAR